MNLLAARNISVRFGGVQALDGVDVEVRDGELHGLIGPNGAGKTTLINIISGLTRAGAGQMEFAGRSGGPWPMDMAVRLGIIRTFQQSRAFLGLTVEENLRIAERSGLRRGARGDLAETLGLGEVLGRVAGELPYAMLRRLGLALALALRPRLLLLDEPAVGLTGGEIAAMAGVIREARQRGITILLVEHNIRFLMSLADRVSVLNRGRMLFVGTPGECQRNQQVIDVYLGGRGRDAAG